MLFRSFVTYVVGYVQVYINGVFLDQSSYTATTGTSVTLSTAANAGDIVEFVAISVNAFGAGPTGPTGATGATNGLIKMEQLAVTSTNTISNLTYSTNNNLMILYVNGTAYFPIGTSPSFSVSGNAITWLSTYVSVTTYDTVVAVYSH